MTKNRPNAIIWFERLYILSVVLALFDMMLLWDQNVADFESDPELLGMGNLFYVFIFALIIAFSIVLWFFVAIQPKLWAKWAQVILMAISVVVTVIELLDVLVSSDDSGSYYFTALENMELPYYLTSLYFVSIVVSAAAVYMLFLPGAISWFEAKGLKIDGVFD